MYVYTWYANIVSIYIHTHFSLCI